MRCLNAQIARLSFALLGAVLLLTNSSATADESDPSDPIAGKSHWAFQPLAKVSPPAVQDASWPRSPIDRFVLARLENERLTHASDADARALVRRAYFQLVGLPPSPETMQAFLDDDAPDAFERLVDWLLASPHFGERFGRHWLDLARFADSNGLDENFLLREAWRYRNWVIDAVAADTPFDRFLLEQIAGDLLPFDSIEQRDSQRIAAGFLLVGPKVLLNDDAQKQRMEIADELIDTVGRAILGQTLGCARCHDHKFDPFPTADYYSLAGIFTSTQIVERRYMLGEQRVMERLVGLGVEGDAIDGAYEDYWRSTPRKRKKLDRAAFVLELFKQNSASAFAALLEAKEDGFADGARDRNAPLAQRVAAQQALVDQLKGEIAKAPPIPPRAMIPADVEAPADERIRLAGEYAVVGESVPRGFPRVLVDEAPMAIAGGSSGRIELANWLTESNSRAGQLAARVLANRIWKHVIGRGLVDTVDNFGRTGETPSHPELLDYLAHELIESGWSVKSLVRQIVLSRTFALSASLPAPASDDAEVRDPDNRMLWRGHRRRLDPEALRDAMLAAAGELDLNRVGSTVSYLGDQATAVGDNKVRRRTDFPCRSVYLPVIRNDLPELFATFDFADPHAATGARTQTIVPTQGLFLLNDEAVMDAAQSTAKRLLAETSALDSAARVDRLFELVVGAPPAESERRAFLDFIDNSPDSEMHVTTAGGDDASSQAWTLAVHALFASSRFQYLE